ncbi:MAG: T9SS type A sorting domain-containing protein [Flavobacteriales bacterium]|nr:T9SS type A sorting domain-containing protein [Flavobacteriales bacterium]
MRYLSSVVLISGLYSTATMAQLLPVVHLEDEAGNAVHGSTIVGDCQWTTDTVSLLTSLNGSVARTINVRRHELWPVSGTKNFYCWGVCFLPANSGSFPTWVSNDPVDMTPGVEIDNFHAYYQPQGQSGATLFRFVWYDLLTPNASDSAWVDIQFCGQVGIEETDAVPVALNVWPIPALGQDINMAFTLDNNGAAGQLALYSVLGERIRTMRIAGREGRVLLGTSDLTSGVYFVNLERDGRTLATRRVVVAR